MVCWDADLSEREGDSTRRIGAGGPTRGRARTPGAAATGRSRNSAGGTGGPTRGRAPRPGPDDPSCTGLPLGRNPPAACVLAAGAGTACFTPASLERRGGAGGPIRRRGGEERAGIARWEPETCPMLDSARETSPPEASKNRVAHRLTPAHARPFGFQVALPVIRPYPPGLVPPAGLPSRDRGPAPARNASALRH